MVDATLPHARLREAVKAARLDDPHGLGYGRLTAAEMQVEEMRQILVWPLALAHPSFGKTASADSHGAHKPAAYYAHEAAEALDAAHLADPAKQPWSRQSDRLRHVLRHTGDRTRPDAPQQPDAMHAHTYEEFVYFHPFVQRFLYRQAQADEHASKPLGAFSLFQRRDLTRAEVTIPGFHWKTNSITGYRVFDLTIDRLNLYLFDCGVALLAIEFVALSVSDLPAPEATDAEEKPKLRTAAPLTVADVLVLQNALRRCYTPYWKHEKYPVRWHPAEVPSRVALYDGKALGPKVVMDFDCSNSLAEFDRIEHAKGERSAPFFEHWKKLLPLKLCGEPCADKGGIAEWRHVVDERIPSLTFVSTVQEPRLLRRGDHARLCFMDTPGSGNYAYHPGILDRFEADHCYDRFWSWNTRQMFSGYSYVVLTEASDFARDTLVHHFRRHYFQIAMLSHMEAAALLTYSGWISEALVKHARDLGQAFTTDVLRIKEELLTFVHQYRFTGLSNQLQPGEMQAYWRRHLKLDELFADVATEIDTARDYLSAKESRDQTQAATNITLIAGLAAVIGLPMAFLGSNFVVEQKLFGWTVHEGAQQWALLFFAIAAASALSMIALMLASDTSAGVLNKVTGNAKAAWHFVRTKRGRTKTRSRPTMTWRLNLFLFGALLISLLLGCVLSFQAHQNAPPECPKPAPPAQCPITTWPKWK